MAKNIICDYCGKKKYGASYVHIENEHFPELKKDLFFCDKNCFSAWKKSFLNKKNTRKTHSKKEKLLENPERKASDEDLVNIFQTLTSAQKKEMVLHMLAICYARSDKTVKGILQTIDNLMADRNNKKKFDVSDSI